MWTIAGVRDSEALAGADVVVVRSATASTSHVFGAVPMCRM
jgi:hypothetical protein